MFDVEVRIPEQAVVARRVVRGLDMDAPLSNKDRPPPAKSIKIHTPKPEDRFPPDIRKIKKNIKQLSNHPRAVEARKRRERVGGQRKGDYDRFRLYHERRFNWMVIVIAYTAFQLNLTIPQYRRTSSGYYRVA